MKTGEVSLDAKNETAKRRKQSLAKIRLLDRTRQVALESYEEFAHAAKYAYLKPMKKNEWFRVSLTNKACYALTASTSTSSSSSASLSIDICDKGFRAKEKDGRNRVQIAQSISARPQLNERFTEEREENDLVALVKTFDGFNRMYRDLANAKGDVRERKLRVLASVFAEEEQKERGKENVSRCRADAIFKARMIETWMLEDMLNVAVQFSGEDRKGRERATNDDEKRDDQKAARIIIKRLLEKYTTPIQREMISKSLRDKLFKDKEARDD